MTLYHNISFIGKKEAEKKLGGRSKPRAAGFTLVETLVAISILIIALTGPLAIIAQSLKSSYFSRDEITAAYLAQEPIEYIRNKRDENGLRKTNSSQWMDGLKTDGTGTTLLMSNPDATNPIKVELVWQSGQYVLKKCAQVDPCRVRYDPTNSYGGIIYGNTLSPDYSIFTRTIYLNRSPFDTSDFDAVDGVAPDRELVITVVVSWKTGAVDHNVTVVERLTNWQLENQS